MRQVYKRASEWKAEHKLRHDPCPAAHTKDATSARRTMTELGRDVYPAVADTDYHDALAASGDRISGVTIAVRVNLLAGKMARIGIRPFGIPVMPVGDDQDIEVRPLSTVSRDFPDPIFDQACVSNTRFEPNVGAEIEVLGILAEITMNLRMVRIGGNFVGHRVVPILRHSRISVDVKRVVRCARTQHLVPNAP